MTPKIISSNVGKVMEGDDAIPYMIEVELNKPSDFLMVVETLTRIGVPSAGNKVHQSAHLLRRDGNHYIACPSQLRGLFGDAEAQPPTRQELGRTARVAMMMENWGLLTRVNPVQCDITKGGMVVVPFNDTKSFTLVSHFDFKKDI